MGSLPVKVAERKEKAVNSRRVCMRVSDEQRVSGQRGDPRSGREHSKQGQRLKANNYLRNKRQTEVQELPSPGDSEMIISPQLDS